MLPSPYFLRSQIVGRKIKMATYKMNRCSKDRELYWYEDNKGNKLYSYRHRYYDSFGRRKEKAARGFKNENQAYRELLRVKTEVAAGNFDLLNNENLTVEQWAKKWLEANNDNWKVTTANQRAKIVEQQIIPLLGNQKLAKLDKETYQVLFLKALKDSDKYHANTIKLYHRIFKIMINAAVDAEILPRNRFTKISIIDDSRSATIVGDNFYTPEELKQFLQCVKDQENITVQTVFALLAATGMRRGEVAALRWKDIDLENGTINIGRTRDRYGERAPKTENSIRTLNINESLIETMKKYRAWSKQYLLAHGAWKNEETFHDSFALISYQTCEPISDTYISSSLKRVVRVNKLKEITPHGFRHTFATILINSGVPVTTIAKLLGNTAKMVMEVYSHSFEENEKRAAQVISDVMKIG